MKNAIKSLGLAALLGFAGTGCQKDSVKKEYIVSGENFNTEIGRIYQEHQHQYLQFQVHSEGSWRDYPSAGKPLPRGEVTEYQSGKIKVDLYFPSKF